MQHHFEKRGLHSKLNFVNIWKISMCNLKEFWNNLDFKSETVEIWISRQYFFVYFTCCNTKTREISWREIQILTKSLLKSKLVFWYAFIIWHSSFTGFNMCHMSCFLMLQLGEHSPIIERGICYSAFKTRQIKRVWIYMIWID